MSDHTDKSKNGFMDYVKELGVKFHPMVSNNEEVEKLQSQLAICKEALEWIAKPHWNYAAGLEVNKNGAACVERAREALEKLK